MIIKRCCEQYKNIHLVDDSSILGEKVFKANYGQYIWGARGRANQLFYFQRMVKEKMSKLLKLVRGLVLLFLLLSCLAVGVWLMWIALVDVFHGKSILVPDYKGIALSNALEQKPAGLEFKVVEQKRKSTCSGRSNY